MLAEDSTVVTEKKRNFNLRMIKTYNAVKTMIWNCVLEQDEKIVPRYDQRV